MLSMRRLRAPPCGSVVSSANPYDLSPACWCENQPSGSLAAAGTVDSKPGLTSGTPRAGAVACGSGRRSARRRDTGAGVRTACRGARREQRERRQRARAAHHGLAVGDRALARRGHEPRVLAEQPARVARRGLLPRGAPLRELASSHVELDEELVRVDGDRVAFLHQRDRCRRRRPRARRGRPPCPRCRRRSGRR